MSEVMVIRGGRELRGSVRVSGAKNSALKLMAASLLTDDECRISNVPDIGDVRVMAEVLRHLGAEMGFHDGEMRVRCPRLATVRAPYALVRRMRASIIVLGPLLARYGRAEVALPGGCNIGSRKIDLHLRGLTEMGVELELSHGYIVANAERLRGNRIILAFPSVGATENLMMAAVGAEGTTCIANAAREPEIKDLADFLTGMGARIQGAGTDVIEVEGGHSLHGVAHRVIGDRIEAGTFAVAACAAGGEVSVEGVDPGHLQVFIRALKDVGAEVEESPEGLLVRARPPYRSCDVATLPYPGFPTDLQPPMMVLLSLAQGISILTENVFESRFLFVDELRRMGCDIDIEGHHAIIRGVPRLSGAEVCASDLRAGAALVVAGLAAEGETVVSDIHHIDRGYEGLEEKLRSLGADIQRREGEACVQGG